LEDQNTKLYSTQDIAEACEVSTTTIRRWILTGKLEEVKKLQGKRVFNQADLDRFLAYVERHREQIKERQKRVKGK